MHGQQPRWWALLTWMLAWAIPVHAEEAKQLSEVVVTATRTQSNVEDATTSVSVVSDTEINQRDQTMVGDALRGTPGMDVTEFGAPGQTTFATIRGTNPDHSFLVLLQ